MGRAWRWTPGVAVRVVVAILACVNVIAVKVPHASLVVAPVCAAGLITLGRLAGLSWKDLGLGAGTRRRGARWAEVEIAAVAVVFAVGAALALTANAFRDSRYHVAWPEAMLTAFVLIPVGTVLLEEVAFRGVLWGLSCELRRRSGSLVASAGLHWATNALGVLASAAVWAWETR